MLKHVSSAGSKKTVEGDGQRGRKEPGRGTKYPSLVQFLFHLRQTLAQPPALRVDIGFWGVSDVLLSLEIPSSAQDLTQAQPCFTCHKFTRNNGC